MNPNAQFETWQVALPRRVATLARIEPIQRFEGGKAARNLDLEKHDLRTLSLMVFDAVIERMGLAAGASQSEITTALNPLIVAAEPRANPGRILEIGTAILDFLMNEDERRRAFREEIKVVENGVLVTREIFFHYLQQVLGPNDEVLYRATVEGINLYTGTLGLDLEDAHAANAAVLKYQIGRGRFREAVSTARQAVAISTAYEQKVKRALDIARRDVTQVKWAEEILSTLTEAREHLRTRIDADNEILRAVEEHEDEAAADERTHVFELAKHIHTCQSRHSALHVLVMQANDVWLNEHSRQAFRPRALGVLPDIESSILRPFLNLFTPGLDAETAWNLTAIFLPPSPPPVADGRRIMEFLLAPPPEHEERGDLLEPESEEMPQAPDRFTEYDYRDAEIILERSLSAGIRVSELIERARTAGHSETIQTLVYLLVLREYGEAENTAGYRTEPCGRQFTVEPYFGDDLFVGGNRAVEDELV